MTGLLLILFAAMPSLLSSCDKDREHPVPHVLVNFNFNIIHYNLNSPGMSHQFSRSESGGYQGIIVYRVSMDEFRAFDRACPCDPDNCMVSLLEDDNLRASDPCCGSVFLVIDGSVVEGSSNYPLKQYNAIFDPSTNRLTIRN